MTTSFEDRTFDRLPQDDERNRLYPIRALVTPEQQRAPRSYSWRCPVTLDQGREGACVGFAWAHELAARPVVETVREATAQSIYRQAQQIDQWPGEDYEGTSVLAGAKVLHGLGHMTEYRWAESVADLILALGFHGPAVLGVNWHTGMFDTDHDGFIHASGEVRGGHAILAYGVSVRGGFIRLHNSWGPSWGQQGTAKISFGDMALLLEADGEACIPVGRTRITS